MFNHQFKWKHKSLLVKFAVEITKVVNNNEDGQLIYRSPLLFWATHFIPAKHKDPNLPLSTHMQIRFTGTSFKHWGATAVQMRLQESDRIFNWMGSSRGDPTTKEITLSVWARSLKSRGKIFPLHPVAIFPVLLFKSCWQIEKRWVNSSENNSWFWKACFKFRILLCEYMYILKLHRSY